MIRFLLNDFEQVYMGSNVIEIFSSILNATSLQYKVNSLRYYIP